MDTLHFLYRQYVYHEDGGSCFHISDDSTNYVWHCNTKEEEEEEEEKSTLYKPTM